MDEAERQRERERERDNAYRAIGRYIVQFSRLVKHMRLGAVAYFSDGSTERQTELELLLGEAPAQTIANAFFGLCQYVGNLDADEQRVASVLSKAVRTAIDERNRIAHGDWYVGRWMFDDEAGPTYISEPLLRRILPASGSPITSRLRSPEQLDALSNDLGELLDRVAEFGELALGTFPLGGFRVRDVLTVEDPPKKKQGVSARVVRNGPKADEKLWAPWSRLYEPSSS